jgi:hypothetical protein
VNGISCSILSLVSGVSAAATRAFTWGTPVPAFGVGKDAEWKVEASGVEAVHLYLAFDGRHLYVAAPAGVSALLDAAPIGSQWMPVPVGAELRFGAALLRLRGESADPRERATRRPELGGGSRVVASGQTLPLRGPPASQLRAQQIPATLPLPGGAGSIAAPASHTVALERPRPRLVPVPVVSVPWTAAPGSIARGVPASPAAPPLPSTTVAAAPAPIGVVPAARVALEALREDCAHTVSDDGALRDLAARVARGIAAASAAPAPSASPDPAPPGARNASPARALKPSGILTAWTRTSWPKRATIILLPFAGYFGVLWQPAQLAKAPPAKRTESAKLTRAIVEPKPAPVPDSDPPEVRVVPADAATATATATPPADAAPARAQRDALMAAFEGDLEDAARLYDRLAIGPDERVYSLAARFSRERAVRKP